MDFLHNSLGLIEHYMLIYGYWAVFFGVMLENAGLPVPGETILLVGGYFAASHPDEFNLVRVMATAAVGAVVGDNIGFAIGHHYGRGFLLRIGRFFFLTPKRFAHMEKFFESHGNKTILVARFITGLRVRSAPGGRVTKDAVASLFRLQRRRGFSLAVVITPLGFLFGHSLPLLVKWVGRTGTILLIALIAIAIIAWRIKRHRSK